MKAIRHDRRSQRTRQSLADALVSLLREHPYDAIQVSAIIERANIGRSTFYTHFYDKDDLLESAIEQVFRTLGQQQPHHRLPGFDSAALFDHIESQRMLFKALARGTGLGIALRAGQRVLIAASEQASAALPPVSATVPPAALAHYLAATFVALVRWWLDNDLPYTAAEIEAMYQTLVLPGAERAGAGPWPSPMSS